MFVEPAAAGPGDVVAVTYAEAWDRGILYAIDAEVDGEWERRFLMVSDASGGRPVWFAPGDPDAVVEAVGVAGRGPDQVLVPEDLDPGAHRICTANAGENICTPIEIVTP